MSRSHLVFTKRRYICLKSSFCRQLNLILATDWDAVLPFRNGRRFYAQRSGYFGLCAEIFDGLFVGHGAILGAPNLCVKECLTKRALGLPT